MKNFITSSKVRWVDEHAPELKGRILATLSMEGCIPELKGDACEANTRGGLGIYFGDKLEGLSAIGMKRALGCMPLYSRRLVQSIRGGRQHIEYKDVSYEDQALEYVIDNTGKPLQFDVWGWDEKNTALEQQYHVDVYSISRGGTPLYVFYCPEVFDILYPDHKTHPGRGRVHRFLQEIVFAECVYELFKSMRIVPDILHLNESHVADAAAIVKGDRFFNRTAVVYTNHTIVPAGLEKFCIGDLFGGDVARARYVMRFPGQSCRRLWEKFVISNDGHLYIDFSKGAIEICDIANGVSGEHAEATKTIFQYYDRTIEAILNGSGDTWVMDELLEMELNGIEPTKEIFQQTGRKGKALSLAEVKRKTADMTDRSNQIIGKNGITLDLNLPTVWMVRRMVEYKSQLPILKDIIHIICAERNDEVDSIWGRMNGLGMQVVVGGIAPEGSREEEWIEQFVAWMQRPELKGRFVYVPNSGTTLLRMQAIGADICINCPLPEKEACGTSDQRSARNGGINIATQSGGPPEYIREGKNGMLVGPYESNDDFYRRAPKDILDKLRQLSDIYYNDKSMWLYMKLKSYLSSSKVTAAAMEQRYSDIYVQSLHARENIIHSRYSKRHKMQVSVI
jgi:glucan phosphorylase